MLEQPNTDADAGLRETIEQYNFESDVAQREDVQDSQHVVHRQDDDEG